MSESLQDHQNIHDPLAASAGYNFQPRLIPTEGEKAKAVMDKGTWGEVWRKQSAISQSPPSAEWHWLHQVPPNEMWWHVWNVASLEHHNPPGYLFGADHISSLFLGHTKIFKPPKLKQMF